MEARAKNITEVEYTESILAVLHPNAQRHHGPKVKEQVEGLISNARLYGFDNCTKYLKAEQWDSFEQWFAISFPHIMLLHGNIISQKATC